MGYAVELWQFYAEMKDISNRVVEGQISGWIRKSTSKTPPKLYIGEGKDQDPLENGSRNCLESVYRWGANKKPADPWQLNSRPNGIWLRDDTSSATLRWDSGAGTQKRRSGKAANPVIW